MLWSAPDGRVPLRSPIVLEDGNVADAVLPLQDGLLLLLARHSLLSPQHSPHCFSVTFQVLTHCKHLNSHPFLGISNSIFLALDVHLYRVDNEHLLYSKIFLFWNFKLHFRFSLISCNVSNCRMFIEAVRCCRSSVSLHSVVLCWAGAVSCYWLTNWIRCKSRPIWSGQAWPTVSREISPRYAHCILSWDRKEIMISTRSFTIKSIYS